MKKIIKYLQHSILGLTFLSFAFLSCEELEDAIGEIIDTTFVFDTSFVYDTVFVLDTGSHLDSTELWVVGLWDAYSDVVYTYDTTGTLIDTDVLIFTKELDGPTDTTWATIEFKEPGFTDPLPRYEVREYDFFEAKVVSEYGVWFAIEDSLYVHDEMHPDSIPHPMVFKYHFHADTLVLEGREEEPESGSVNDELIVTKLLRRD